MDVRVTKTIRTKLQCGMGLPAGPTCSRPAWDTSCECNISASLAKLFWIMRDQHNSFYCHVITPIWTLICKHATSFTSWNPESYLCWPCFIGPIFGLTSTEPQHVAATRIDCKELGNETLPVFVPEIRKFAQDNLGKVPWHELVVLFQDWLINRWDSKAVNIDIKCIYVYVIYT